MPPDTLVMVAVVPVLFSLASEPPARADEHLNTAARAIAAGSGTGASVVAFVGTVCAMSDPRAADGTDLLAAVCRGDAAGQDRLRLVADQTRECCLVTGERADDQQHRLVFVEREVPAGLKVRGWRVARA